MIAHPILEGKVWTDCCITAHWGDRIAVRVHVTSPHLRLQNINLSIYSKYLRRVHLDHSTIKRAITFRKVMNPNFPVACLIANHIDHALCIGMQFILELHAKQNEEKGLLYPLSVLYQNKCFIWTPFWCLTQCTFNDKIS